MYRLSAKTSNQKLLELRFDMRAARHDPDRNVRPSLPVGLLLIVGIEHRFISPNYLSGYAAGWPRSVPDYQSTMYLTSLWAYGTKMARPRTLPALKSSIAF